MIVEIITIVSTTSAVVTAVTKLYLGIRGNKYAADYARIYQLNQHDRGKFTEIVIPHRVPAAGHTHGQSAASRSAGSSAAAAYAYAIGKVPFYMSMSASDQRADRLGERTMHWSKDFNAEARRAEPDKDSVLVMIDVDEHINDLPSLLHKHFLPTILYTFQPSTASGTCQDYRFTFNRDNELVYDVAGGGHYQHEVWDYSPDCLTMRKTFCGLTYAKSFFTVEKRHIDANHQLVLLTPLAKFGLLGCITSYNVSGAHLSRLRPVTGDFIRLAVAKSLIADGDYEHLMSTAKVGTYNAATISMEHDDALAIAARNSESKLSPFQVKSMVPGIDNAAAVTLVDYHRLKLSQPSARVVIPTDAVNNYTYNPVYTLEEKPSVSPFMSPILPDAYAPTQSVENDVAMVKGRITDLRKPPKPLEERELKYAIEFAALLKEELGVLEPVGHEEIVEKLNRPEQRRITDEAAFAERMSTTIKSFMKKESYQKPTDPRPIATINGKDKYEYSAFTYAVSEALKKTSWYAFGRKPVGISERVADVCMAAMHVVLTDLSRFDGRVNLSLRQLEEIVMKALFPEKYWKQMLELMSRQYKGKGYTKLGVKYKNGYNRQSGSPETAIFNTILNAFMAYVTFREAGCDMLEAYRKLGIYGGDDGLTPDVDPKLYTEVAASFGHVLEAECISKGKKGVSFLARLYSPDVWYGSNDSCADIARALSKFHVTTTCDIKPVDKLFEKAFALYLTDATTPIIGDFVCRVVELSGKGKTDYKNLLHIWNSELLVDEQYPNENSDGWMNEVIVDQKLDGFKLTEFRIWLEDCKTLEDVLQCPAFIDKPETKLAKVAIKLNDELMLSESDFDKAIEEYKAKKKVTGDVPIINLSILPAKPPPVVDVPQPTMQSLPQQSQQPPTLPPRPRNRGGKASSGPPRSDRRPCGGSSIPDRCQYGVPSVKPLSGKSLRPPAGCSAPVGGRVDVIRHHPTVDLCTQGIEPNPGPSSSEVLIKVPPKIEAPKPDVLKKTPPVDLTTQGVEPNPGPSTSALEDLAALADEYVVPYLPEWPEEQRKNFRPDESINGLLHSVGKPISDAVYYVLDPVLEYFSPSGTRHGTTVVPPQMPLVGIETNPGPVVLPVRGRKTASKQVKLAAEVRRVVQQQKKQIKATRQPPAPTASPMVAVSAAYSRGHSTTAPRFLRTTRDSMTIWHTELVHMVTGTVAFTATTLPIQVGLGSTFRWLSTQTTGWEKYRFKSLRAIYETRTGSSTPGSVILSPDYDAADPAPTTEIDASSYYGTKDDAPWKEIVMDFNMSRNVNTTPLFIRSGPLAANLDIKTYDFANLHICTVDGTAVSWGKVFLEYEVELINPHVSTELPNSGGSAQQGGGGVLPSLPFGNIPVVTPGAFIESIDGAGLITIKNLVPGQEYQVTMSCTGTTLTTLTITGMAGLTLRSAVLSDLVNAGGTLIADHLTFIASANTASWTYTANAGATVTGAVFTFSALATGNF
jgi:hypothetical protein